MRWISGQKPYIATRVNCFENGIRLYAKVRSVRNLMLGPVVPASADMNDRFSRRTAAQKFTLLPQFSRCERTQH